MSTVTEVTSDPRDGSDRGVDVRDGKRSRAVLAVPIVAAFLLAGLIIAVTVTNGSRLNAAATTSAVSAAPTAAPVAEAVGGPPSGAHDHGPAVRPGDGSSPCEQAAPNGNGGGSSAGHGERGTIVEQPVDSATKAALDEQLASARAATLRYPTAADAKAAGYIRTAPYLPCIAAHYTNSKLVDPTFDAGQPEQLLYDGNTDDAKIVGVSYLVATGAQPPPGFAGPNDPWHQHIGLCMNGDLVVGAATLTDEQCTSRGGVKTTAGKMWMVHAWVVPGHESAWGVFSGENPALGALVKR